MTNSGQRMESESSATSGEPGVAASARPRVVERYSGYTPPFDVAAIVERMLASVPPRYLLGLSEVILTNKIGLSRSRRRSVTKSRGRKVKIAEARGLYHRSWKGEKAWIEIFVDNTLNDYKKGWWRWLLHFGYFRESEIGGVLFTRLATISTRRVVRSSAKRKILQTTGAPG